MKTEHNNTQSILDKRAKQLAREVEDSALVESSTILLFTLGLHQKYALRYHPVLRVNKIDKITQIPNLHPLFMGVIYTNAEVWPVIHGVQLYQTEAGSDFTPNYLIFLQKDKQKYALAVDTVIGLTPFNQNQKLTKFEYRELDKKKLIDGVYGEDIALINIDKTFNFIKDFNIES